jgi:hypothetical protein
MSLPNELLLKILRELLIIPQKRNPGSRPGSGKLHAQILRTCHRLYDFGSDMLSQNGSVAVHTSQTYQECLHEDIS